MVRKLAGVYFVGGEPYEAALKPLKLWGQRLKDAAIIRNRVVHRSDKCVSQFKEVARRHRGQLPTESLPQGYRVGNLLAAPAVPLFPQTASGDYFDTYLDMYADLAKLIVR